MDTKQINSRDYSNLLNYRSHPPPNYGRGIYAPYFAASPMRSDFKRGDIATNNVFNKECCEDYAIASNSYAGSYINQKMLRQKKM